MESSPRPPEVGFSKINSSAKEDLPVMISTALVDVYLPGVFVLAMSIGVPAIKFRTAVAELLPVSAPSDTL